MANNFFFSLVIGERAGEDLELTKKEHICEITERSTQEIWLIEKKPNLP